MKFHSFAALALTSIHCANALSLGSTFKTLQSAIERKGDPIMFDDVHLPKSLTFKERVSNLFEHDINTNKDVINYLLPVLAESAPHSEDLPFEIPGASATLQGVLGMKKPTHVSQPRPEIFRKTYTQIINTLIKNDINDADPCEGYRYFGSQDYSKILPKLLQINPFWSAALTSSGCKNGYFELNAYSEDEPCDSDPKFLRVMRTMIQDQAKPRRINVRFNKDMTVNRVVSYATGKACEIPKKDWNEHLSAATYNAFYFCNIVHSLIHVYHYYMCAAIGICTKHDKALAAWANPYDDNIAIKYYEVVLTLFKSNLGDEDAKTHTGKNGLGGTPAVMDELRDYLCIWGSCKTTDDFTKKFLLKDLYDTAKNPDESIEKGEILTEFRKHLDLVEPFANELTDAMKANDPKALKKADEDVAEFLADCGEGLSSIDSVNAWVQSMSCTGLLHGGTLGYSRMFVMPEIMRWRDIKDPEFNAVDVNLMMSGTGVLAGRTIGRHVFTGEIDYEGMWDTSKITPEVKAVLDKYDDAADKLQNEYKDEIEKDEDFLEYGWIMTEHGPDGYDGKQHTLTSYI